MIHNCVFHLLNKLLQLIRELIFTKLKNMSNAKNDLLWISMDNVHSIKIQHALGGGVCPGGCLPRGGVSQHALRQTPPYPRGQNNRQV